MAGETDEFARGWALHQAGNLRAAEDVYRRCLVSQGRDARIWFALAQLCEAERRLPEALGCLKQALELNPRESEGFFLLGNILLQQKKHAEAETVYRRCLEWKPDHALALGNLGFACNELERLDDARSCYERALKLRPDLAEVHHNLGNVLREQGHLAESLISYQKALQFRPEYAKAFINRGIALIALGRIDEAVRDLERGEQLKPDLADAHASLGAAYSIQQRFDAALAHYDKATALQPDHAETRWNQSLIWLLRGDYARGWPAYEWRWKCKRTTPLPTITKPRWDGAPLDGRTILLYGEQGLGDTIQFARYAALCKARGGRVLVQCQNALLRLLSQTPGIDGLVGWGATPPPFDVWQPLMSLPAVFGTTVDTIPAEAPYVHPDPDLVAFWRRQLAPARGFRVGIAWQGSPRHAWDRHRSVALDQFEPLARVPGVQLISLQKGTGSDQLSADRRVPVLSLGNLVDETSGPFMDTAAILANLDLVITIDTAIAHLAGAMGVPTWVALTYTPDWRWLLGRADSVWYPSLRLFRQPKFGDWPAVFAEMAQQLAPAAARVPARPWYVELSSADLLLRIATLELQCANGGRAAPELAQLRLTSGQLLDDNRELLDEYKANRALIQKEEAELQLLESRPTHGKKFVQLARSLLQHKGQETAIVSRLREKLAGNP